MSPLLYIYLIKGIISLAGIFLIGFGIYLSFKKTSDDFDFSISILEKISTKLKGQNAGLFLILLGCILLIAILLIPIEVQWQEKIEEQKIQSVKDMPIKNEKEIFGNSK